MELTAATFSFERHCRTRSDHENLEIVAQTAHTMDDNICPLLALYTVILVIIIILVGRIRTHCQDTCKFKSGVNVSTKVD